MDDDRSSDDLTTTEEARIRQLVVDVVRGNSTLAAPPVGVWEAIAAEVGMASALVGEPVGEVVSLADHRERRRVPRWLGAAAAVAGVAGLGVIGLNLASGGAERARVAAAVLGDSFEGSVVSGTGLTGDADLFERDGQVELDLDVATLPDLDGFYEVWVIDPETFDMYSLGPLDRDGEHDLPPGVDPEVFSVVDVSIEPTDGVPTHSGASVLRGQLQF